MADSLKSQQTDGMLSWFRTRYTKIKLTGSSSELSPPRLLAVKRGQPRSAIDAGKGAELRGTYSLNL